MALDQIADIVPIRNNNGYEAALARIEELWGADPNTPEGTALDVLVDLVEHYEDRHFPISQSDPIDIIRTTMTELGKTQKDLAEVLGSPSRASEILNKKRALKVDMIHKIERAWGIPASCLVTPYDLAT